MTAKAPMFPGIYFDTVQPALDSVLPRMDIASFVGFASSGPLHTPVVVEDLARFRDIFGADLDLAWDDERNFVEQSFLGAAVENFFRNGGKRCWVVRVADEDLAQTARFAIPGLYRSNGEVVEQACADARSPGSWAELVRLRPRLNIESLQIQSSASTEPVLSINDSAWNVDVVAHDETIKPGDLISVNMDGGDSAYYLVVSNVVANEQGVRLSGTHGYYYFNDVDLSPPVLDPAFAIPSSETEFKLFNLSDLSSLGVEAEWPSQGSPGDDFQPLIRLLSFNLRSLESIGQTKELVNLRFCSEHHRFWAKLPNDKNLYSQTEGQFKQQLSPETLALIQEANAPRFPAAGTSDAGEYYYLPLDMAIAGGASSRAEFESETTTLLRNGLRNFGSVYFVDERLTSLNVDLLAREANRIVYLADKPGSLKGLHSLLTLKEATLIAVPDAIHRRWDDVPPHFQLPLAAPYLNSIEEVEELVNTWRVHWSPVSGARFYSLEWSKDPDFTEFTRKTIDSDDLPKIGESLDLLPEPDTEYFLSLNVGCPQEYYFRVRAEKEAEVSAWSNNRALFSPQVDFIECSAVKAELIELNLNISATASPAFSQESGDYQLTWVLLHEAGEYESVDSYELQRADDHAFTNPEVLFDGAPLELEDELTPSLLVYSEADSSTYFRVRAKDKNTLGPWSNTILLWPSQLSRMTFQNKSDFSEVDLLAIHRALMRTCAARADLFAVLSLPRHYEVQDVLDHYAKLKPTSDLQVALSSVGDDLSASVRALAAGEIQVSSHAALYFPWFASRTESTGRLSINVRYVPPDGAVLGKIAGKAVEQGPWIAPANSPFEDVLALEKNINREQWKQLMQARINVIRQESRGYLLMSADTLSTNSELDEINVRRLMSMIRRIAEAEGNRYVFENNNTLLHDKVKQQFETIFARLYERGAFAGKNAQQAYRVVTGSDVNTIRSIEAGRFVVELHVAPSRALKFIRVRLVQEGNGQIQLQELAG